MNPNLTSLRLDFCGQLDDSSFKLFTTHLSALERIELLGPFLVRAPAWKLFFQAHRNLEGFLIHQSPRFDLDCVQTLISSCPVLKELRLREVGKMSDEFLNEIASLGPNSLAYLDLGCPATSCSDDAMIEMLQELGAGLTHLDVAKHETLTRRFLDEGLAGHTGNLEFLGISHLPELTDKDVTAFFSEWENTPLVGLDASRNSDLAGESLTAIMKHSGLTLETLNINGWKDVEEEALQGIGRKGKELRQLDVGFCRNINDFVVKDWLEGEKVRGRAKGGCKNLKELKVWGCNRVTSACPRKVGLGTVWLSFIDG
jgi:DNA repair protein RAD7